MTAISPAIDPIPSAVRPRWRITWAERENGRRRRAYDSEAEAWRRRDDQLIRLQIEAAVFRGYPQPHTGLPVDLDDDEVIYRVLPAANLVEAEARHVAGLPTPRLTISAAGVEAPGRALPSGLRVVDAGLAVVTNRRVVFSGRDGRREWTYADMVGLAHHPGVPVTLLHTTDGSRLTGLLAPAAALVNFRFYLTLAFADATGRRGAVVAQTDALRDAHRRARPAPPPPVEPDHAPLTALRPDRRTAVVAAVVALTFATLPAGPFGREHAGLPYRADADGNRTAVTSTDALPAVDAAARRSPAGPAAPDSGTGGSVTDASAPGGVPGADGPVPRQRPTSRATSAAPTVVVPGPAARPAPTTGLTPTAPAAPTTGPAVTTTSPPTTAPDPTTGPCRPGPPLVDGCVDPLRLPLVVPLRCPPASA